MTDNLPDDMTAIEITSPGGPEVLQPVTMRRPYPEQGELLIKVAGAGVNRPDMLQRQGLYPPPPGAPETPGLEISGTVAVAGRGASKFAKGDAICALVPGGGYAEYCVVHEDNALRAPKGLDLVEAGAVPETFFTVWTNVFQRAGLKAGESLLVHGGTSGIGTTAIMLAKAFGATVFATAGSQAKCDACTALGATRAINYMTEDFVGIVREETSGGVNVVLDMVGGDYIERNIKAAAVEGRIVSIAFLNGPTAEVNFMPMMLKRLTLTGSTLRARSVEQKALIAGELEELVWPLLEAGDIKPVIDSKFPLTDAAGAHQRMESSEHIGKIILEC
jgi:NADPH2:quinone reductase